MKKYIIKRGALPTEAAGFAEASREELRVLVAIGSLGAVSEEEISAAAGVSRPRALAALAFWVAEGIIEETEAAITEEFAERLEIGETIEEPAREVAKTIRDESLAELLSECAALMDKPALSTAEVKIVCALVSQYALTPEYILTLAAYLGGSGKLTAVRLRDEAIRLVGKRVDTTEALEVYIKDRESESSDEQELRRILGIYGRRISSAERALFKKWTEEFGFGTVIIGEAYGICVMNTGKLSFMYMDKIMLGWHKAGCKTLEECRALTAASKAEEKTSSDERPERKKPKTKPEKPRYGDFDINDAFAKALERSYGEK